MKKPFAVRILVFSVLLAVLGSKAARAGGGREILGERVAEFSVTDIGGKTHSLYGLLKGHDGVVVNFWGLRCGPCIEEIPALNKIFGRFRGKVAILGVNVDAVDADLLRSQIEKNGLALDYTVVPDPDFKLVDLFNLSAAPYTVVIDREGVVRYVHQDYKTGDETELEKVLDEVVRVKE
jgi:peroxiredoxin